MTEKPSSSPDALRQRFESEIKQLTQSPNPKAVEDLRIAYLGRKGLIQPLIDGLRDASKEERPVLGKKVNELRTFFEETLSSLKQQAEKASLSQTLKGPALDVSLPVEGMARKGSLHPVSLVRRKLVRIFRRMGFTIVDGPEVDLDFYNFGALNFKDDHPARDMQDTFFVERFKDCVMRTHTSNIQIHAMVSHRPPLRIVALGRVYRCDSDPTHTPMFHQIEGVVVDRNISMADMKGVVERFVKEIFGVDKTMRLRPSYFPFVEPGAEIDMSADGKKWLEIGGLGMIHPNVLEAVGYDSETYTGFAFGFGVDRMAMMKYEAPDLRMFFEGNRKFLNQFPVSP